MHFNSLTDKDLEKYKTIYSTNRFISKRIIKTDGILDTILYMDIIQLKVHYFHAEEGNIWYFAVLSNKQKSNFRFGLVNSINT